jgi:hypothetical protein
MVKKTAVLAAAFGLFALSSTSSATVLIQKNLAAVTQEADVVVSGTVTDVWAKQTGNRINTFAEVHVDNWVKGDNPLTTVLVKAPGGSMGDLSMEVPSAPELAPGQEVYLFLSNDFHQLTNVVGWAQGTFHVEDGVVLEAGVPVRTFERRIEAILDSAAN